ncbi:MULTISPECIES: DUF1294 domain-containing protein [Bacteroides]|jgi:uncharacterized membrane protein YsdA (DUF1294 family)|uniref:DUF1294 domain-containing protein n=1 Tax=Bacteroides fragilis TaxID=817 RepID=UPI0002825894|nr:MULTISPECIES: DUF1294 domain-containing protein [Bacteroides]EKA80876.1 hypothetical protein HMPREF1205_04486 [Bacteroides fragilis HMW 616]MDK2390565.1 DUF1294 domain-containing protein [Bacteroides fragilis]
MRIFAGELKKSQPLKLLFLYLIIVNTVSFVMYGIDKRNASRKRWRTPEVHLLGIAVAGGSLGAWAGMYTFRHKTRHLKFKYGIPVIGVLQVGMEIYYFLSEFI